MLQYLKRKHETKGNFTEQGAILMGLLGGSAAMEKSL
jgi:hypothetical protein